GSCGCGCWAHTSGRCCSDFQIVRDPCGRGTVGGTVGQGGGVTARVDGVWDSYGTGTESCSIRFPSGEEGGPIERCDRDCVNEAGRAISGDKGNHEPREFDA